MEEEKKKLGVSLQDVRFCCDFGQLEFIYNLIKLEPHTPIFFTDNFYDYFLFSCVQK